jgi:WD40 repeat protein
MQRNVKYSEKRGHCNELVQSDVRLDCFGRLNSPISLPTTNQAQAMHGRTLGILRGWFLILIFVSASLPPLAIALEPQPGKHKAGVNPGARSDIYGDPLPSGTLARIGTVRDYIGEGSSRIIFSPGGKFVTAGSVFIRPDGKTLASGADDGSLWLWDLSTGREIRQVQGLTGSIESLAFAPSGKTFAAVDERGIWLVDTNSGKEIHHFPGAAKGCIRSLSFAPDGTTLAWAHDQGLSLWNVQANRVWLELAHPWSRCVVFARDGTRLATGDMNGVIRVWDAKTGRFVREYARPLKRDVEPPRIESLAFTPDGKTLASSGDDHFVTLWDLDTGQERRRLKGHLASVNSLALAPDGKTLASGSADGTALIWDLMGEPDFPAKAP